MIRTEIQNQLAWVIVERPQALNALNSPLLTELCAKLEEVSVDNNVRVVILTGSGERSFIAGADIEEWAAQSPLEIKKFSAWGQKAAGLLEDMKKPVIAAINGYALGGGLELAMACDLRIAADSAKLGLPEAKLGVFPGWGVVPRIVRIAGLGAAKELLFTGRMVTADTAAQMRIVDHVVPAENLRAYVQEMAEAMASNAPTAVALMKEMANRSACLDRNVADKLSADLFAICTQTADAKEGIAAFKEKRRPVFNGK